MSATQLAELVRRRIATCKCGAKSIAWYRNKLKNGAIKSSISPDESRNNTFSYSKKPSSERIIPKTSRLTEPRASWPDFGQLDSNEMLQLAKLTTRRICFLRPDIVREVVEDNERRREGWSHRLKEKGVDPSLYLWKNSSCAFPGVRRYAGGGEIAIYRRQKKAEKRPDNAVVLDDNTYPKQIWSFVFQGKKFANAGPPEYSLAHLVDHKIYKNRLSKEFDNIDVGKVNVTLFGLYTCPTNTVYMPNGLMRPTDFSFSLRNLIQRKAEDLYGGFCNLAPPHLSLKACGSNEWSLDSFDWRDPVGMSDHVLSFLRYRNERMEKLLDKENN